MWRKEKMCPCRVFFGAAWHLDGRQMFQIKAIYKNTPAQKIEKYESFINNDFFLQIISQDYNFFGKVNQYSPVYFVSVSVCMVDR